MAEMNLRVTEEEIREVLMEILQDEDADTWDEACRV